MKYFYLTQIYIRFCRKQVLHKCSRYYHFFQYDVKKSIKKKIYEPLKKTRHSSLLPKTSHNYNCQKNLQVTYTEKKIMMKCFERLLIYYYFFENNF